MSYSFAGRRSFSSLILASVLVLSLVISSPGQTNERQTGVETHDLVLVCGDHEVVLAMPPGAGNSNNAPEILWRWDSGTAEHVPPGFQGNRFQAIDDCKPSRDGRRVVVTSSSKSGAVAVINMEDNSVECYAEVVNAHSAAFLPGNRLAVASSVGVNGNKILLFEIAPRAKLIASDPFHSAHGVVWVEASSLLYALGGNVLRAYKVAKDQLVRQQEWNLPQNDDQDYGGHDLMITPDKKGLMITLHSAVLHFDLASQQFSKIPRFSATECVKSINLNTAGRYAFTVPEESWWTHHVSFSEPDGSLSFPNLRVYKVRWCQK